MANKILTSVLTAGIYALLSATPAQKEQTKQRESPQDNYFNRPLYLEQVKDTTENYSIQESEKRLSTLEFIAPYNTENLSKQDLENKTSTLFE